MVRALNPWPSTYTYLHGKILKIWAADVFPEKSTETPGTVNRVDGSAFYVKTGDGVLKVTEVQLEGKKRMRQVGSVEVPSEAFMAVLKLD